MNTLRNKVIRLAHEKPELREKLLPLLTEGQTKVAVATRENYNAYLKKTKATSPLKFDAWKQHHERLQNQSDSSLRNSLKRHQKESEKHYDNHGKLEGRAKAVAKRDGDRQHDKAQLVQQHIDYRTQVRSDLNKVKVKVK